MRKKRKTNGQTVNICQNETAYLVRMKFGGCDKPLKSLERVKGIEPSYSAWKAAALPLSYTRAQAMNYHAADAASTAMRAGSAAVPPASSQPGAP